MSRHATTCDASYPDLPDLPDGDAIPLSHEHVLHVFLAYAAGTSPSYCAWLPIRERAVIAMSVFHIQT